MKFGSKNEGEKTPHKVRFKTTIDRNDENLEKDIMKLLISDESEEENEEFEVFYSQHILI